MTFGSVITTMLTFIPFALGALFHVVNPIGSSVLLLNFTSDLKGPERKRLARKIAVNSFVLMTIVLFVGVYVLRFFGLSIPIVQICGGLMIASMGWKSLYGGRELMNEKRENLDQRARYENMEFYPFTFPFTVGPGTIAVTLTISAESKVDDLAKLLTQMAASMVAILFMALTIYLCYGYTDVWLQKMRESLRMVIMRIFSFIMLCIGGQILLNGIEALIRSHFK